MTTVEVPADEDAAYEIQDAISQIADDKIIGFKLGVACQSSEILLARLPGSPTTKIFVAVV